MKIKYLIIFLVVLILVVMKRKKSVPLIQKIGPNGQLSCP